jgi:hypothetical protein
VDQNYWQIVIGLIVLAVVVDQAKHRSSADLAGPRANI